VRKPERSSGRFPEALLPVDSDGKIPASSAAGWLFPAAIRKYHGCNPFFRGMADNSGKTYPYNMSRIRRKESG
jgi:hypothetical protein